MKNRVEKNRKVMMCANSKIVYLSLELAGVSMLRKEGNTNLNSNVERSRLYDGIQYN